MAKVNKIRFSMKLKYIYSKVKLLFVDNGIVFLLPELQTMYYISLPASRKVPRLKFKAFINE